jgi:uncharacterized membrane protein
VALILTFGAILIGALLAGPAGALSGLAIGLLFSSSIEFRKNLQAARDDLDSLKAKVASLEAAVEDKSEPAAPGPIPEAQSEMLSRLAAELAAIPDTASPPREAAVASAPAEENVALAVDMRDEPAATAAEDRTSAFWQKVISGNVVAKVGVVLLFFGAGFLLKYAAERGLFPSEARIAGVVLAGIAMLVFGWRQRQVRKAFAIALQGGGIGFLYLAVFAALRLYGFIDEGPAFALLAVIGLLGVSLALKQEAVALAVLGISGAFLAPILASTGHGGHVVLFGYYVALNAVILTIAAFRTWRSLNIAGFLFTFVVGLVWGARYYQPQYFSSTEPFLIAFFLIYVAISVLSARRESRSIDGALVFGVPIIAFGLQWALVREFEYGAAVSAAALAGLYFILWRVVNTRAATLRQSFAALSILFVTVAMYYAFAPGQAVALWALQGAALVWLGSKQKRMLPAACGLLVQGLAAFYFFHHANELQNVPAILNPLSLGAFTIAVSALASSAFMHRSDDKLFGRESALVIPLMLWGLVWWYFAGLREINEHVLENLRPAAMLIFVSLSSLAAELIAVRLRFPALREQWWLLPVAMSVAAFHYASDLAHPLEHFGYLAWPLAFSTYYWSLQRFDDGPRPRLIEVRHLFALWLLAYLTSWQFAWITEQFFEAPVWAFSASAIIPALMVIAIASQSLKSRWPFTAHPVIYGLYGAGALALFLCVWSVAANLRHSGDPSPLSYVPIFNPLDLVQSLALAALCFWRREWARPDELQRVADPILFVLGLLWLSGMVARTVHHWIGVPFEFDALFQSVILQAGLSILWTLAALALMVYATRRHTRAVWIAGAALLALVTLKLFVVDLANTGTIERIVSFVGVGLLFLAIGYFSPVPPVQSQADA